MVTRAHCAQFVGQHVVFQTSDGMHHGILQSVTSDGIYVRALRGNTTRLVNQSDADDKTIDLLQNTDQSATDAEEAFFPFFFFPFLALALLWPWAWWW